MQMMVRIMRTCFFNYPKKDLAYNNIREEIPIAINSESRLDLDLEFYNSTIFQS